MPPRRKHTMKEANAMPRGIRVFRNTSSAGVHTKTKMKRTLSNKLWMVPIKNMSTFSKICFKPSPHDLWMSSSATFFFSLKFSVQSIWRQTAEAMKTGMANRNGATGPNPSHCTKTSARNPATMAAILLPKATWLEVMGSHSFGKS